MTKKPFQLPPARVFWGISAFQALAMFRRGLFYAFLSIYLRFFLGLSITETTLFATLPMIFNIGAQTLIWGRLSDRKQLRRTLILWGGRLRGCRDRPDLGGTYSGTQPPDFRVCHHRRVNVC